MHTIVVLDVHGCGQALTKWIGINLAAEEIDVSRVRAVVGDLSDSLSYLDDLETQADLVVVSSSPFPPEPTNFDHYGYGVRAGFGWETGWIHFALREGRIRSLRWICCAEKVSTVTKGQVDPETIEAFDFIDLLRGAAEIVLCGVSCGARVRLRPARRCDGIASFWHGSSTPGLHQLVPKPRRLWMSPSKAFAGCFGVAPYSNLGFFQGIDFGGPNSPRVYLVVPAGYGHCLDQPISLYELSLSPAEVREVGIAHYEYVVHRSILPVREERFATAREYLASANVEVVELGQAKPRDLNLYTSCLPYRHAIEVFASLPLEVLVTLPCKRWLLRFWLQSRGLEPIQEADLAALQNILERIWMPAIAVQSVLQEHGYHSLMHCFQVALYAALIAWESGSNPVTAAFAGLFHDAARENDDEGTDHAAAGVRLIEGVMGRELRHLLGPAEFSKVQQAVAGHASGKQTLDFAIGACWDADRLRIAWERGVKPDYFSTPLGLELAIKGSNEARALAMGVFGPRFFDDDAVRFLGE
jgi:hypothetical protein